MPPQVLIICQHFVPYTPAIGGVARVLSFVDFFNKTGYEVTVLTSDGVDFGYLGYESIVDKAKVVYLHDQVKVTTQKAVRLQLNNNSSKNRLFSWLMKVLKRIMFELMIPDPGVLMRRKYLITAADLITANNVVNVIVSSPPHSMQLVGLSLKKQFGEKINLIVDYRDSWNGSAIFRQNTAFGQMIAISIERGVLKSCNHFSYVSDPILNKAVHISRIPIENKSCLVMNGFDDSFADFTTNDKLLSVENNRIRIGHFGMINDENDSYRNIRKLFDVIASEPQIAAKVQFEFYGRAKLSGRYQKDGILFFENLPYVEARKKMIEMDFLLLFHTTTRDSDEVITGKFFEYIASKKPIICISPVDMEARRLIVELGIGLVADIDSPDEIKNVLLDLPMEKNIQYYGGIDVSAFGRSKQYEKILSMLR